MSFLLSVLERIKWIFYCIIITRQKKKQIKYFAFQGVGESNSMLSVGHVVTTSVGMCDIDIRPVSSTKS